MGPDNADLAGPWQLMIWPRQTPMAGWAEDIRITHFSSEAPAIELIDGPWACAKHDFRDEGLFLDLTLVHVESGRTVSGTFDMEDGVWAPSDGAGHMTVAEFHRAYAANNSLVHTWPVDPFKDVRAPTGVDAGSADGEYLIDLTTNRWRMSDWICPPRVVHIPTGDCLLDLKTTYWDARAEMRPDGRAELRLLQYPGTTYDLRLELDLRAERYRIVEGAHEGLAAQGYLDELQAALGRPAADLDEMGILLDVRRSRRPGPVESKAAAAPEPPRDPPPVAPIELKAAALELPKAPPPGDSPPTPREEAKPARTESPQIPGPAAPLALPPRADGPVLGFGPELEPMPPLSPGDIRDISDAIAAEAARRGLQGTLQYELIVIGVIRAAAAGITRPEDAVAILETLASRRGDVGKSAA